MSRHCVILHLATPQKMSTTQTLCHPTPGNTLEDVNNTDTVSSYTWQHPRSCQQHRHCVILHLATPQKLSTTQTLCHPTPGNTLEDVNNTDTVSSYTWQHPRSCQQHRHCVILHLATPQKMSTTQTLCHPTPGNTLEAVNNTDTVSSYTWQHPRSCQQQRHCVILHLATPQKMSTTQTLCHPTPGNTLEEVNNTDTVSSYTWQHPRSCQQHRHRVILHLATPQKMSTTQTLCHPTPGNTLEAVNNTDTVSSYTWQHPRRCQQHRHRVILHLATPQKMSTTQTLCHPTPGNTLEAVNNTDTVSSYTWQHPRRCQQHRHCVILHLATPQKMSTTQTLCHPTPGNTLEAVNNTDTVSSYTWQHPRRCQQHIG